MDDRRALGSSGEERATRYLRALGYAILHRNVRTPFGEIDCIAEDAGTLVFVEVKTRRTRRFGLPEEAITPAKFRHLADAAFAFRSAGRLHQPFRIDVVVIDTSSDLPRLRHILGIGEDDVG